MVWSCEVPDGSAQSMIDHKLEKLRDIAYALNLCNPVKINWTPTSDSASTQKKFNEQNREKDEEKYGPPSFEAIELVEFLTLNFTKNYMSS